SAGEVIRTWPPGTTAPCSSLAVPMRVPVKACAAASCDDKTEAAAKISMNHACLLGFILTRSLVVASFAGRARPVYPWSEANHLKWHVEAVTIGHYGEPATGC